jgi:2-methylcitrate dehydratase PrpD
MADGHRPQRPQARSESTDRMSTQTIAQQLAAWVAGLDSGQVPRPVRAIARACLVDTIGVAVGGADEPVSRLVRDHVVATYAQGASTVLGAAGGFSVPGAALANATAAHALDFDDNCYAGVVHGSAVVAPAVLALCETAGASGADFVTAFIAGVEVEYALGAALSQSIYDKGWWTTGVLGAIGAAAGAAKALCLTAEQTANAIAAAAAGTGGMRACLGTDAKPILAGRAAEIGVTAAVLAARGATGPLSVFEDPRGLAGLFNGDRFDGSAVTTLGASWRLQSPGIDVKKYPLCLSGHAAADGVLDIMREHRLAETDVASVTCTVPPIVGANLTYAVPSTRQQAQFSLPFAAACMMVFGDITLDHLQAATLADADLHRAMTKVRMVVAANWHDCIPGGAAASGPEAALVSIATVDGRKIERFSGWARGTAARPLTAAELDAKFMACAGRALPARDAGTLLAAVKEVEALTDVWEIFRDLAQKYVVDRHQRS